MIIREQHIIKGQVQGVGFRPFVYRIALENNLTGFVQNTPKGVVIEIQGTVQNIQQFNQDFSQKLPPLAKISSHEKTNIIPQENEELFTIIHSLQGKHQGHSVLVSPDVAICDDCKNDIFNPHNKRYAYAFTNCTSCGPRYTITKSIPYDRPVTTMSCFPLCDDCTKEYTNPLDRRFHAQPNACADCGPLLWLTDGKKTTQKNPLPYPQNQNIIATQTQAIQKSIELLSQGKILAIKGLGGFQLAVDAYNETSIQELRKRKNRPHKAFAIMVKDIEQAKKIAYISQEAEELLCSIAAPIVLCPLKDKNLPKSIHPDTKRIGIMLAYTPLHLLLFSPELVGANCRPPEALIMTSANQGGKPICIQNRQALQDLATITDYYLFHNRDILIRVDDSVCLPLENNKLEQLPPTIYLRRARGYVPSPIFFPKNLQYEKSIFATGAFLKNTFTFTKENEAYQSQHIGDLDNLEVIDFFEETTNHLQKLLEVTPKAVVTDLHPDFPSTHIAQEYSIQKNIPFIQVQHHIAHAYSVLAEQKKLLDTPYLALILDGTGLGLDKTIWGSELFYLEPKKKKHIRLASLSPIPLIGGDKATFEPWRITFALHKKAQESNYLSSQDTLPFQNQAPKEIMLCETMLEKNINCPLSSGCGRLFDAISALLGLCTQTSYEGQAAIILEDIASNSSHTTSLQTKFFEYTNQEERIQNNQSLWEIDTAFLYAQIYQLFKQNNFSNTLEVQAELAKIFHLTLIQNYIELLKTIQNQYQSKTLILSGGVFNNEILLRTISQKLQNTYTLLFPKNTPVGDACISLGQAFYASFNE